jgi:hypothetical protein
VSDAALRDRVINVANGLPTCHAFAFIMKIRRMFNLPLPVRRQNAIEGEP